MNFIVKFVKSGKVVEMNINTLMDKFHDELSTHLVNLDCITQISINSEEYGKVLIRKEV